MAECFSKSTCFVNVLAVAPFKLQTRPLSNGFPSSTATPDWGWRGGAGAGGTFRDSPVRWTWKFLSLWTLHQTVMGRCWLFEVAEGRGLGGGFRAECRPLPRHVPVQNGLYRSVKTAQLKVCWEWHKIKAKDLSQLPFLSHTPGSIDTL